MLKKEAVEIKEQIEEVIEHAGPWNKFLAVTTAIIAVFAAIVSSFAGNYSSDAFLQKNNVILYQDKATDQWNYYQAKGIKLSLAENFYEETQKPELKADADRYAKEQVAIQNDAQRFESMALKANALSVQAQAKGEKMDLASLLCQIAIAMSAMSALLRQKILWLGSLLLAGVAIVLFIIAFF